MRIVVLDGYTLNPGDLSWDGLRSLGDVTIYDRTDSDLIHERIGNAEIVITNKTPLGAKDFDHCPSIKYIGVIATGYNVVDVEAASERDIVVTNIPTYGTDAVAQFVFALLLEVCHRVGDHNRSVHEGQWRKSNDFCYWHSPLIELKGKTFGIIGAGRIGLATAKIASAFGMNVIAFTKEPDYTLETDTFTFKTLDEVMAQSDVVSLHCPLNQSTEGIINHKNISKMKDGVIIVNTARGPLIVEEDLKEALLSGKVYGAGLDVLSEEPPKNGSILFGINNCIITPHIAWASKEARERLMNIAVENVKAFQDGKPINTVN